MEGFALFGTAHIAWLTVSAVMIAAAAAAGRRENSRCTEAAGSGAQTVSGQALRVSRLIAAACIVMHLAECVFRMINGTYGINALPLHICAISSYLVIIHIFWPRRVIGELLFCPGIIGAIAALLFPDWVSYAPLSAISVTCFLAHIAIVAYIVHAMGIGLITPSIRRCHVPLIYLAVYAACIIPFDRHFHVNFGFLNRPSPGSPLVMLAEHFGYGAGYYISYAFVAVAGVFACYGVWYLCRALRRI